MVSEQSGYEGNVQRKVEEGALDHSEVHDNEEKCKIQVYTMVTILRMSDKKTFHRTDQNPKLEELMGQVREWACRK